MCGKRTLQDVLDEYTSLYDEIENQIRLHAPCGALMRLHSFSIRDVESYRIVKAGIADGNWLHDALLNIVPPRFCFEYFVSLDSLDMNNARLKHSN